MSKPNIVFRDTPEIIQRLENEATRRGCERSDVIREAIREHIKKVEAEAS
jgi:predicted DNA-binding protein